MNLSEHQKLKLQAKGHIHWIDKKSNNIYKIYKKFNLLDDLKDIEKRLSQIVKGFYTSNKLFLRGGFTSNETKIFDKQKKIK